MPTIRITYIDSVTPGVLGTKVYRDDIEIADVANGVQLWDDTTALEDTTYKYEVQSYTSGGESTEEVIGVNVDNITTSPSIINIYPQDNAASQNPEVNSLGDWNDVTGTIEVSTTDPQNGSYSLLCKAIADTALTLSDFAFTIIDGNQYNIKIWAKCGTNIDSQVFFNWEGFSDFSTTDVTTSDWALYEWTLTANATSALIRVYTAAGGGGTTGDELWIDNITIEQL